MRERTREAVVVGLLDAIAGGDGSSTNTSGPTGFVYFEGGSPAGSLARARLPFDVAGDRAGSHYLGRLRAALQRLLEDPRLADGLRPHPDGWRATKRYLAHTEAMLADPRGALPAYPMVLHRGGWPDGS